MGTFLVLLGVFFHMEVPRAMIHGCSQCIKRKRGKTARQKAMKRHSMEMQGGYATATAQKDEKPNVLVFFVLLAGRTGYIESIVTSTALFFRIVL